MERYYSTSPYAYCLNNPVLHVDRDGRVVETVWDVASLAMGVSSFTENLRQGNIGAAVADGLGIIVDGFAVATPFVGDAFCPRRSWCCDKGSPDSRQGNGRASSGWQD